MSNIEELENSLTEELTGIADRMLGEALENGIETATEYAKVLVNAEENSGLALSKFLHSVNSHWKDFETDGETFPQWAVRATGRDLATVQRRLCTWEFLHGDHIPKKHRGRISQFSIRQLAKAYGIAVKQVQNHEGFYDFVSPDYEISDEKWLALSQCSDENQVIEVVREITGKEPNANRMSFRVKNGDLFFYKGKKGGVAIGHLNLRSRDPLVLEGIEEAMRLLKAKELEEH